jgi:hypothetical protein
VLVQEGIALPERNGMREHPPHITKLHAWLPDERMVDLEPGFADDVELM